MTTPLRNRPAPRPASTAHTQSTAQTRGAAPLATTAPAAAAPTPTPAAATPVRSAASEHAAVRDGAVSRRSMGEVQARARAAGVDGTPAAAASPSVDQVRAGEADVARGHSGPAVLTAQDHLNGAGYAAPTDGRFGPGTERAVQQFQADQGLATTGRVDCTTLGALESHSGVAAEAGRRETDITRAEAVSATTYAAHGTDAHHLSDPASVRSLITHSPQLDGDMSTTVDRSTCGGAAMLNGVLLDGGYQANAGAIRSVARDMAHETPPLSALSGPESAALTHMGSGELTPNEANTLQGLLTRMGDHVSPRDSEAGTTALEQGALLGRLQRAGGLPNTDEMTLRVERVDAGAVGGHTGYHFTVSSRTHDGRVASADSWPDEHGHASVRSGGSSAARFSPGHAPPSDFEAEATLRRQEGGRTILSVTSHIHNEGGADPSLPPTGLIYAVHAEGGGTPPTGGQLVFNNDGTLAPRD